jgi:hypothetical protein
MTTPLYGRAWDIQVLTPEDNAQQQTRLEVSSSDKETSSLRVTFNIEPMYSTLFTAEIDIYNPNLQTIQTIDAGCTVSVAAGYAVEGTPAEIFRGRIFQAIFSKPDSVTTILRLGWMVYPPFRARYSHCRTALNAIRATMGLSDYPAIDELE